MLRAKPFDATTKLTSSVQEATIADASPADGLMTSAEASNDTASAVNMTGLAVTIACLLIAFSLAYSCYARNAQLLDAIFVMTTSFLPLRVLLWIAIQH